MFQAYAPCMASIAMCDWNSISLVPRIYALTEIIMDFKDNADQIRFNLKQNRARRWNLVSQTFDCGICCLGIPQRYPLWQQLPHISSVGLSSGTLRSLDIYIYDIDVKNNIPMKIANKLLYKTSKLCFFSKLNFLWDNKVAHLSSISTW